MPQPLIGPPAERWAPSPSFFSAVYGGLFSPRVVSSGHLCSASSNSRIWAGTLTPFLHAWPFVYSYFLADPKTSWLTFSSDASWWVKVERICCPRLLLFSGSAFVTCRQCFRSPKLSSLGRRSTRSLLSPFSNPYRREGPQRTSPSCLSRFCPSLMAKPGALDGDVHRSVAWDFPLFPPSTVILCRDLFCPELSYFFAVSFPP